MPCPIIYNFNITGDCTNTNSGAFTFNVSGTPNFTLTWLSPNSIPTALLTGSTDTYTLTGLSAGTYSVNLTDGCVDSYSINFTISSGTCVGISDISNTTCGLNNGSITASTSIYYGYPQEFYLYELFNGYITSGTNLGTTFVFNSLTAGTYYVIANDGGGCSGSSESCIIQPSSIFDYTIEIEDDSSCGPSNGSVYITSINGGSPPFNYLWSNGGTNSYITGLTSGLYNVTITDNDGCVVSASATVNTIPPLQILPYTLIQPTCFNNDGSIIVQVTGGTEPYIYYLSNGQSFTGSSTTHEFSGLASGNYTVTVNDSHYCTVSQSVTLLTPAGFSPPVVVVSGSTCNNNDGSITVTMVGSPGLYTFNLSGASGSNVTYNANIPSAAPFIQPLLSLPSDTYLLTITNSLGCTFTQTYTVTNTVKFNISASTIGTTCGLNNGSVTITVGSGGTPNYTYTITGNAPISSSSTAVTINNLSSGSYTATVTDTATPGNTPCTQTISFTVPSSTGVDFTLDGIDTTNGNDGIISALIFQGEPPFTLTWSPNVGAQTGLVVTGLTPGNYSLTVIDDNGCAQNRPITIGGFSQVTSYQTYNVCDSNFQNSLELGKKGIKQMLLEGYYDLTIDDFNCVLNKTIFIGEVVINGIIKTLSFYTGTTLSDYPSDEDWYEFLDNTISDYEGIKEVIIKPDENQLIIITICANDEINFNNSNVKVDLIIKYDISCVTCNISEKQFQDGEKYKFMSGDDYWLM
jgi:hypothetical protein